MRRVAPVALRSRETAMCMRGTGNVVCEATFAAIGSSGRMGRRGPAILRGEKRDVKFPHLHYLHKTGRLFSRPVLNGSSTNEFNRQQILKVPGSRIESLSKLTQSEPQLERVRAAPTRD